MAGSPRKVTFGTTVIFWAKVLILCFILGGISFYIGRNYLGHFFSESELNDGAPEIVAQVEADPDGENSESKEGPDKAEIVISQRHGSDAEIERAKRELNISGNDADRASTDSTSDASSDDETANASDAKKPNQRADVDEKADEKTATASDSFVVIAGSFLNAENSDRVVKELQSKGYQPYISKSVVSGKTYRRVNLGAFSSRGQATDLADKLRADGYEVTVGTR